MATSKEPTNPFYVLLVVCGVIFVITAAAYGVMAFRAVSLAAKGPAAAEPHPLLEFLDRHGLALMAVEVVILAISTFAAMGTDRYWYRRDARRANAESKDGSKQTNGQP